MTFADYFHKAPYFFTLVWSWIDNNNNNSYYGRIATLFLIGVTLLWILLRNKSTLPGPWGLPLLGHLLFLDPELHAYFAGLARIYGPILKLRIAKKVVVVISSPTLAREVLKDNDITFANRDVPVAARVAFYGGCDMAWTPYGPEWRMLRKVSAIKMFSNTSLDSTYDLRRKVVRQRIKYLYDRVGIPVNVGEQMFLTIMNVITNMLWGGSEEMASFGAEFQQVVREMTMLLGKSNVSDFCPILARFDLQGIEKQMKELVMRFDRIFDTMIDQRLRSNVAGEVNCKDVLQSMLKWKDEEYDATPFTMTHLKAIFMDMVVGGADTSSNTIEIAMGEIMNNPQIMRNAQEELDKIVGKNKMVEESDMQKLPYLNAIMKETLRLHPALPLLAPHSPSRTATIGGHTVPKRSCIFINVWAIQRDPLVWENPKDFNPTRFLSTKWDYSGNNLKYFPFGSGRRICAGIEMAERMVLFSLASMLHCYEWRLVDGEKAVDLSEKYGIVMKKKTPLIAIPTPRLSEATLSSI